MMRLLLVNPPIYDFSAYDFWLKPYGLLRVAGQLRGRAEMRLFDYMDRLHPLMPLMRRRRTDTRGRGEFHSAPAPKPAPLRPVPRRYHRFGLPRAAFREFVQTAGRFDVALVQGGMTYWYPGVREVIEDLRALSPGTRIVLGGVYPTLCPAHARGLGADLVVEGVDLAPLWGFLGLTPDPDGPPLWEAYGRLKTGVMRLADGCPFRCTYCSVPRVYAGFQPRPMKAMEAELDLLARLGARDVAFYDDALLHQPERVLFPFLEEAAGKGIRFHTPNALHARLLGAEAAQRMVSAGFKTFYLGFESRSDAWQGRTGGKVSADDLVAAVERLKRAGADLGDVTAYLLLGHPDGGQGLEESMRFAHGLGIRVMLSEFSPIPGTPDGELCRRWTDMDEPLCHSKTAFPIARLGVEEVNRVKDLCRTLNRGLAPG